MVEMSGEGGWQTGASSRPHRQSHPFNCRYSRVILSATEYIPEKICIEWTLLEIPQVEGDILFNQSPFLLCAEFELPPSHGRRWSYGKETRDPQTQTESKPLWRLLVMPTFFMGAFSILFIKETYTSSLDFSFLVDEWTSYLNIQAFFSAWPNQHSLGSGQVALILQSLVVFGLVANPETLRCSVFWVEIYGQCLV